MLAPPHHRRIWTTPERSPEHSGATRRILITAGPTHEPIDAVRFIGNRSSGRMGVALASAAAARGWVVTLLLGPTPAAPPALTNVSTIRFRTCDELERLLIAHTPKADILVMAAAVADYRPRPNPSLINGKFRRTGGPITLELEPTPDLLAATARTRRPDQVFVGFALEPRADLLASARSKLARKRIDLVVANPLETMDSDTVEAMVLGADGSRTDTPGHMAKAIFAPWLLDLIADRAGGRHDRALSRFVEEGRPDAHRSGAARSADSGNSHGSGPRRSRAPKMR